MSIRDQFKGAKLSSLKETRKDAEKKSKTNWGSSNRPGFHTIEEGRNVFKIAPPHNPEHPSMRPLRTAWLECNLPKRDDDGNETEELEIRKKRIFISTIHSTLKFEDPVELYIDYVREMVNDTIDDKDERVKKLAPITGWKDKSGKWTPGIRPSTNYVVYAWKGGDLGRVELYPNIVQRMEELNIESDDDEGVMETDCFSDPDSGVSLVVEWDKSAKKTSDKWKINKSAIDFSKFLKQYRDQTKALEAYNLAIDDKKLSDEQLAELASKESLTSMYVDVYSKRDFELALNGLTIFDEKHGFGIFENEEFLTKITDIEKQVPEKTEKEVIQDGDDITENFKKGKEAKEEEKGGEDFSTWKPLKMKRYLKQYIIDNYDSGEVLPDLSDDDLIKWCELASKDEELPFSKIVEETEQQQAEEGSAEDVVDSNSASTVNSDVKSKIEAIKAKKLAAQKDKK